LLAPASGARGWRSKAASCMKFEAMKLLKRIVAQQKSRRRSKKKSAHFLDADVLIVSHGKSGRTWLRTLISHLYHQRYGIPETQLIHYDNFHRQNPEIPKICLMGRVTATGVPSGGDPAVSLSPRQKLILLLRDPRDVAVSFYFQIAKRATEVERLRKGAADEVAHRPIFDVVMDETLGIPRIIRRMNAWETELGSLAQHEIVRYEELRAETQSTLRRVADFIGGGFTDEEVAKAVAFASFESLKEKERAGHFDGDRLKAGDTEDPDSFKVRRGKVGGYKDYFTPEQLERIDALIRDRLSPAFGYHDPVR
jgi:hypothetical protein